MSSASHNRLDAVLSSRFPFIRYFPWIWTQLEVNIKSRMFSPRRCEFIRRHGDVIKWNHFPRYWPFVRGIHRSPVNSPHKGQWRGALMFSLICPWINGWVNNREAGDLRRHRAHYDVNIIKHKTIIIFLNEMVQVVKSILMEHRNERVYPTLSISWLLTSTWRALVAMTFLPEFPSQRLVTRSFDVFFDLRLNKQLSKQIVRQVIWDAIAPIVRSQ